MKTIFYMVHVPWNWIKQRPHFIAEELTRYARLTVLAHNNKECNKSLVKNIVPKSINLLKPRFPIFTSFAIFEKINTILLRIIYSLKSDIIWVPFPLNWYILGTLVNKNKVIIYDCMDDALAFDRIKSNKRLYKRCFDLEKKLVERSNIIFASSNFLAEKLRLRYEIKKPIYVINNAIVSKTENYFNLLEVNENLYNLSKGYFKDQRLKIVYIGTISVWFDWTTVIYALDKYPNMVLYLFGPSEIEIPIYERIIYVGPIPHDSIYAVMNNANLLVMPFIINELVLSVNPVKLYEYIGSGIPSVAVRYAETEKFEEFVYLYSTKEEFCKYIEALSKNKLSAKRSKSDAMVYLQNNTWSKRVSLMWKIIEDNMLLKR